MRSLKSGACLPSAGATRRLTPAQPGWKFRPTAAAGRPGFLAVTAKLRGEKRHRWSYLQPRRHHRPSPENFSANCLQRWQGSPGPGSRADLSRLRAARPPRLRQPNQNRDQPSPSLRRLLLLLTLKTLIRSQPPAFNLMIFHIKSLLFDGRCPRKTL